MQLYKKHSVGAALDKDQQLIASTSLQSYYGRYSLSSFCQSGSILTGTNMYPGKTHKLSS